MTVLVRLLSMLTSDLLLRGGKFENLYFDYNTMERTCNIDLLLLFSVNGDNSVAVARLRSRVTAASPCQRRPRHAAQSLTDNKRQSDKQYDIQTD